MIERLMMKGEGWLIHVWVSEWVIYESKCSGEEREGIDWRGKGLKWRESEGIDWREGSEGKREWRDWLKGSESEGIELKKLKWRDWSEGIECDWMQLNPIVRIEKI